MSEEHDGYLYGYIESLEAALPDGNEVVIQINFRDIVKDIQTQRDNQTFLVNRKMRFHLNIKTDAEHSTMQEKMFILKMFRITEDEDRRLFGDFRINLQDYFRPDDIELQTYEIRAKMKNTPTITCAFGTYFANEPPPPSLTTFAKRLPRTITLTQESNSDEESDSFDELITSHTLLLADQSPLEEYIIRNWYDLSRSKPGYPGFGLAKRLKPTDNFIKSFQMLEDVRTTIKTEESAILFYFSVLCLYQNSQVAIKKYAQDLVYKSMETAASLIAPHFYQIMDSALQFDSESKGFAKCVRDFTNKCKSYKTQSSQFLLSYVLDQVDCQFCNRMITQNYLNTLTDCVRVNSLISDFETMSKINFPRFRQALLVVIAHDTILNDYTQLAILAPKIPPNFIFFLLCLIKPDNHLPKAIDYKKIETFAMDMNVNFKTNISDEIMFKPANGPIPSSCREFLFNE